MCRSLGISPPLVSTPGPLPEDRANIAKNPARLPNLPTPQVAPPMKADPVRRHWPDYP